MVEEVDPSVMAVMVEVQVQLSQLMALTIPLLLVVVKVVLLATVAVEQVGEEIILFLLLC
mgnify:CR=1 FL=1